MRPLGMAKISGFDMARALSAGDQKGKVGARGWEKMTVTAQDHKTPADIAKAIAWLAEQTAANDASVTARMARSVLALIDSDTATGRRIATWQGDIGKDMMPLRLCGGPCICHN